MASQKFTKVTLFFNCKLLYGGENKIFAYKHEMITKLSQISDARKEINFINGRTVPFSKEFSMHFKWEEFPTYRDKPFNYPNYAVFTDGTVSRTFGYFVTSSNTKNLPSDTVELFFKYDSFINNSNVIKKLKNKPIERITLDGFRVINDNSKYLIYNDTQSNDFKPNTLPSDIKSPYYFNYPEDAVITLGASSQFAKKQDCFCVFIKYLLDSTSVIETANNDNISFPDEYPLKTVYLPYCIISKFGQIDTSFKYLYKINKTSENQFTADYMYRFLIDSLRGPISDSSTIFKIIQYLDSKAIYKTFTFEPINQVFYSITGENRLYTEIENLNNITKIDDTIIGEDAFFCYRKNDISIQLPNYYSINFEEFNNKIFLSDSDISKIIFSIGALHIYPFNYYKIKTQNYETNLTPLRNEGRIDDSGHIIMSLGLRDNMFNFTYKVSGNYPKFIRQKQGSQLPISKSAVDMYLMSSSNQIQNEIKYTQMHKKLNDDRITANTIVGATGVIGSLASLDIAGAITSAGKTATDAYFGYENEKLKLSRTIDTNKAKIEDLQNTNGDVSVGDNGSFNRVLEENMPLIINYGIYNYYELELLAIFINKYGIDYNTIMKECFEKNHENFDYYKFLEFDEQELDIQPNDERKEVYNILTSGVRIWHNLEKMGSENSYNQPISFTEFNGGN